MNLKKAYPIRYLVLPVGLYTALFILPSLAGFGYALSDWNTYNPIPAYIGLANFVEIFTDSRNLLYLANTIRFALITTLFKVVLGLALALLLDRGLKTRNLLRTLFYYPVILSPLVIGLVFRSILQPKGILNEFLRTMGLDSLTRSWLVDPGTAMGAVMAVEVWRMAGYCMVIFLAGLQTIPKNYYEAAQIDGAGPMRRFRSITLPFLRPALTINLILNIIWGLKVFDIIFVLTKGGPGYITGVINTAVYLEFSSGRYGVATAFGVVIFLLTSVAAAVVLRLMSRNEKDEV